MNSTLSKLLSEENIYVNYEKLNDEILGCYYSIDGYELIVINETLLDNIKLHNCILAEEIGHYKTSAGDNGPYLCNSTSDDLNHSRTENRALKYAVDILVPTEKLLNLIMNYDVINACDLSDYFEVTKDFILLKFYFLSLIKMEYELSCNRFLVLSSYPSIYIYENFERRNEYGIHSKTS